MLPPKNAWIPAPMLPMTLRERTVMPRTTPRFTLIRQPSKPKAVVTQRGSTLMTPPSSDLEDLWNPGEVPRARLRHEGHVLDPHTAETEVVEPRLHGHDVAGPPCPRARRDRRRLVDLETEAVARAVKEPLHPPPPDAGPVTVSLEESLDFPVDGLSVRAI